ncbi:MAG: hypothetical protein WKG00_20640 [Polyangiaceae bacterium]
MRTVAGTTSEASVLASGFLVMAGAPAAGVGAGGRAASAGGGSAMLGMRSVIA